MDKIQQLSSQVVVTTQDVIDRMEKMTGKKYSAMEIAVIETVIVTNQALQSVIKEKQTIAELNKLIKPV